jgi:hypothetical protein
MNNNLDPNKIVETIHQLHKRISERFPDAGLGKVCCKQLHTIATENQKLRSWIRKPHIMFRVGMSFAIIFFLLVLVAGIAVSVKFSFQEIDFANFLQVLDAGINIIILLSAALFFLVTAETRRKRNRAMIAIHQLRALAHVIDMHQLTKDPEGAFSNENRTPSSPRQTMNAFELTRYLDYCTEMLSLVGKVAALYIQDFDDPVLLGAVNEVENLTTGLSRKIWQKIMIIYRFKQK